MFVSHQMRTYIRPFTAQRDRIVQRTNILTIENADEGPKWEVNEVENLLL